MAMITRMSYAMAVLSIFLTLPSFAVRCSDVSSTNTVHSRADRVRIRALNLAREIFGYFPGLALGENDIDFVISEDFGWSDYVEGKLNSLFAALHIATVFVGIKGETDWKRIDPFLGHEILHIVFMRLIEKDPALLEILKMRYPTVAGQPNWSPQMIASLIASVRENQEYKQVFVAAVLARFRKKVSLPEPDGLANKLEEKLESFAGEVEYLHEVVKAIEAQNELFADEILFLIRKDPSVIANAMGYPREGPFQIIQGKIDRIHGPRPRDGSQTFNFNRIKPTSDPHLVFDGIRSALWELIGKRFKNLSIEQIGQAIATASLKFDIEKLNRFHAAGMWASQADDSRLFFRLIVEELKFQNQN
ncbi:MAG: hypothetical protein C5B49_15025 [Bdellovibrio sp.]|nr:MAG: hypothetical protein C5B49_15025 [Bdellovibrio sp.]